MKIKSITKSEVFEMEKPRYNAFQSGYGVKVKTPKHPTRKEIKQNLKKEIDKWK